MAAGAVSQRKSHYIVILSFCNIVNVQAHNQGDLPPYNRQYLMKIEIKMPEIKKLVQQHLMLQKHFSYKYFLDQVSSVFNKLPTFFPPLEKNTKAQIIQQKLQIHFIHSNIYIYIQGRRSRLKSTSATSRLRGLLKSFEANFYNIASRRGKKQPVPWHGGTGQNGALANRRRVAFDRFTKAVMYDVIYGGQRGSLMHFSK